MSGFHSSTRPPSTLKITHCSLKRARDQPSGIPSDRLTIGSFLTLPDRTSQLEAQKIASATAASNLKIEVIFSARSGLAPARSGFRPACLASSSAQFTRCQNAWFLPARDRWISFNHAIRFELSAIVACRPPRRSL